MGSVSNDSQRWKVCLLPPEYPWGSGWRLMNGDGSELVMRGAAWQMKRWAYLVLLSLSHPTKGVEMGGQATEGGREGGRESVL